MCTIPPIPPPPPSDLTSADPEAKSSQQTNRIATDLDPGICLWALEFPELREACAKSRICTEKSPYKFRYKFFESIIQVGPTCGLTALSMLVNEEVSAAEMLSISQFHGYTCNGEMFSCKNMFKLIEKVFSLAEIENLHYELRVGTLFSRETIEDLLAGAVLLVPYDADCNHSPTLRKGHTAHWSLVCGILIDESTENDYNHRNVYVLTKHGKSKHLAIWNLYDLDKSNKNLIEFSPKKGTDGLMYVLPEGGIGGEDGLRDQFLMIKMANRYQVVDKIIYGK